MTALSSVWSFPAVPHDGMTSFDSRSHQSRGPIPLHTCSVLPIDSEITIAAPVGVFFFFFTVSLELLNFRTVSSRGADQASPAPVALRVFVTRHRHHSQPDSPSISALAVTYVHAGSHRQVSRRVDV